jgi:hypothetical protein
MIEDAAGRWALLLPLHNADATATAAASQVSPGAPIFEVVVACADCGVRQSFGGTVQEIGVAAEVWKQGHQCPARRGKSRSAAPTSGITSDCQASANAPGWSVNRAL